ncbi:NmrA domain-containing protein [Fusarium sp. LHS14.1]|nr:NmrA domain-containing protein [Fusarium sp. LHS14.1]
MVTTIAVAGGTRGIGRAIAEAINRKENYDVKIFSRSANPALEAENGIPIIAIDYTDIDSMTKVLEDNKIDTVISALFVTFDGKSQVDLIHAAEASKHTRRFIPSIWGIPYSREHKLTNGLTNRQVGERQMTIGQSKLDAVEALEKSTLEYTLFYGYPRVKSYQRQNLIVVDIEYNKAAIPGDGNTPVTFTHTFDVAEFVAASLELPSWEKESYIIGDSMTWNEFLRLAEEVKGEKFEITHDSLDLLLSGQITELPSHPSLYSQMPKDQIQALFATFGVWFEKGLFNLKPINKTLNEVFPEIHARTVKEILEAGWGKE